MRRSLKETGGAVLAVLCVVTLVAAPASARRRHHRHRHHPPPTCGPNTVLTNGVCVADPPVGDTNVTVTPDPIVMTRDGHLGGSLAFTDLLPFDILNIAAIQVDPGGCQDGPSNNGCKPPTFVGGIPCGPAAVLTVATLPVVADATGKATAQVFDTTIPPGPGGCVPGTYPLVFLEVKDGGTSPARTFTVFVTLTF